MVKRPLMVVRNSTERPEVMGTFATLVQPGLAIGEAARSAINKGWSHLVDLPSPYGDGGPPRGRSKALGRLLA